MASEVGREFRRSRGSHSAKPFPSLKIISLLPLNITIQDAWNSHLVDQRIMLTPKTAKQKCEEPGP
jgi:hypothetical protein